MLVGDWVQAVEPSILEEWSDEDDRLPIDYAAIAQTLIPLLGMAFFIGLVLVRSLQ